MSELPEQPEQAELQDSAENEPRRKWWVYLVWAGVGALILFLGYGLLNANETRPEVGKKAPDFAMTFYDGYEWTDYEAANLSDLKDNIVVLNFWASWCGPCEDEADVLEQGWQAWKDDDVILLGIAYSDIDSDAHEFMEHFNITYPNAPDLRLDASDKYRITGVPETFFIDKDGIIAYVQPGPLTTNQLDSILIGILEG